MSCPRKELSVLIIGAGIEHGGQFWVKTICCLTMEACKLDPSYNEFGLNASEFLPKIFFVLLCLPLRRLMGVIIFANIIIILFCITVWISIYQWGYFVEVHRCSTICGSHSKIHNCDNIIINLFQSSTDKNFKNMNRQIPNVTFDNCFYRLFKRTSTVGTL